MLLLPVGLSTSGRYTELYSLLLSCIDGKFSFSAGFLGKGDVVFEVGAGDKPVNLLFDWGVCGWRGLARLRPSQRNTLVMRSVVSLSCLAWAPSFVNTLRAT